jgi:hypothetical protein
MRTPTIPQGSASQFSKNCPNVVISQMRCLADEARTDELLDTRVRDVEASADR